MKSNQASSRDELRLEGVEVDRLSLVTVRTGVHRLEEVLAIVEAGEENEVRVRRVVTGGACSPAELSTGHSWHVPVTDHHVGMGLPQQAHGVGSAGLDAPDRLRSRRPARGDGDRRRAPERARQSRGQRDRRRRRDWEGDLLRSGEANGGSYVEVEDDGPGMSPDVEKKVFDPFFTTKGTEGTGLGLAIVYATVERYGGNITLDTALGRGTRFRLWFPAAPV